MSRCIDVISRCLDVKSRFLYVTSSSLDITSSSLNVTSTSLTMTSRSLNVMIRSLDITSTTLFFFWAKVPFALPLYILEVWTVLCRWWISQRQSRKCIRRIRLAWNITLIHLIPRLSLLESDRYIWMSCWKSWVVVTNGVPFHIWKVVQICGASVYVLW